MLISQHLIFLLLTTYTHTCIHTSQSDYTLEVLVEQPFDWSVTCSLIVLYAPGDYTLGEWHLEGLYLSGGTWRTFGFL